MTAQVTHPRRRRLAAGSAAAAALLLLAAGCADPGDGEPAEPAPEEPQSTQDSDDGDRESHADAGPECAGEPDSTGTRVLFGGEAELPGGGTAGYKEAHADGTTRHAGLSRDGGDTRQLALDDQLTVRDSTYTVTQICSYRVILTPDDPELAPGSPQLAWPDWPPTDGDGSWTLSSGIEESANEPELNVFLATVTEEGPAASIVANANGVTVASYDVAEGATVELAGKLWEVAEITPGTGDMADDDFEPHSVTLRLVGPAVP